MVPGKTLRYTSRVALLAPVLLLAACGRTGDRAGSPNGPASALGDSPALTGTVANPSEGDTGSTLELRVGYLDYEDDSGAAFIDGFAQAPVAADGSFALQLPGETQMVPRLVDARPVADEGCDVTITPDAYKTTPPTLASTKAGGWPTTGFSFTRATRTAIRCSTPMWTGT